MCLIQSIRSQLNYQAGESAGAQIGMISQDDTHSWGVHWLTGGFSDILFFAESPLGQNTNIQDRELQCLPAQQAQRPVQWSPGVHSKTSLWTITMCLILVFLRITQYNRQLLSRWVFSPTCPSNNYQFLELTQYPIRAAHCGFSR